MEENTIGECPFCGSNDTSFEKVVIKEDSAMGYLKVWCNECKSSDTIDRVQF